MNPNIKRFDQGAAVWDENPSRAALARSIVNMAEPKIAKFSSPRILDFGCGTGMCSIPLAHRASTLVAMDLSSRMLEKLREKAEGLDLQNIETVQHDLLATPLEGREFDVIITGMALHHVKNVPLLIERFRSLMAKDGVLLIADLDREDGSFHDDPVGVEHYGFDRDWMVDVLRDAGFRAESIETAHSIMKPAKEGSGPRSYPVFLISAHPA